MLITLIGFITGMLIGLTGTGGGVLLTPLLMVLTPYPAVILIGTDIVNGAFTKLLGVFEHRRLGQVRWRLATFLIAGTVPGATGGIVLLSFLKTRLPEAKLDHLLRLVLGLTLFCVSFLLPLVRLGKIKPPKTWVDAPGKSAGLKLVAAGALVGFQVALTSIGSGSLLMIFLLLLTPYPLGELVGTDILYGLATMALAGFLHVRMGHFDSGLFLHIVIGSLPGVVVGSRLTRIIPERYFSWLFTVLYFSLGTRLLVG
ncbi:MAG: sulfite exporter TauE/SafE family protein [Terriglobia bacterium]